MKTKLFRGFVKGLIVPAAAFVGVAAVLSGVAYQMVTPEDRQPWQENLNHQLESTDVKDSTLVVVLFLGVSDHYEDANEVRELYASYFKEKWPDVSVIVLPTYAGGNVLRRKGRFQRQVEDLATSLRREVAGSDIDIASALSQIIHHGKMIVGIGCHSGAGFPCNDQSVRMIEALDPQGFPIRIAYINTDLRTSTKIAFRKAGYEAVAIQQDLVTTLTKPWFEYSRFFGLVEKAAVIASGLPGFDVSRHSMKSLEKPPLVAAGLDLDRVIPEARHVYAMRSQPIDIPIGADQQHSGQEPISTPRKVPPPDQPPGGRTPVVTDPGGIDFTTVQLRYLKEDERPSGPQLAAAFHGDPESASTSSAWRAFFTWLALPDETFWVNLNPDEPDRIIDNRLAPTNVGRVMLEADFQLKKDLSQLTRPDVASGRAFWDGIDSRLAETGWSGVNFVSRVWIVPGDVIVWEHGDEVYVVEALLDVRYEVERVDVVAQDGTTTAATHDFDSYLSEFADAQLLPALRENITHGDPYAALRQAFYSRVVAEWYKSTHQSGTAAYTQLIDSGNVPARDAGDGWNPQDVYQRYLDSFNNGEYTISSGPNGNAYFTGGVDLTRVAEQPVSFEDAAATDPDVSFVVAPIQAGRGPIGNGQWIGEGYSDSKDLAVEALAPRATAQASRASAARGVTWVGPSTIVFVAIALGAVLMLSVVAAGTPSRRIQRTTADGRRRQQLRPTRKQHGSESEWALRRSNLRLPRKSRR